MRAIARYTAYPAILIASIAMYFLLFPTLGADGAQTPATFAGIGAMAFFERVVPHHREWGRSRGDVRIDILLNIFGALLPSLLFNALCVSGLVWIGTEVVARLGFRLWPSQWPIAVQVVLAVVVAEFFVYWMHRALHCVEYLWRFHSVHHSAERLYWLNANRVHPVETILAYFPSFGALVVVGAPPIVLGAWGAIAGTHGITQHMNVDVRLGWCNFVFSTPALHRWHHSRDRKYADGNYGAVTIIWDLVFGTRILPPVPHAHNDLGIERGDDYLLRGSLAAMVIKPFRVSRPFGHSYSVEHQRR